MSSKILKEKKEIEYETRRSLCDLCGEMIKEGAIKFRLRTSREEDDNRPVLRSEPDPLDICSTDCLKENINGLIVTLQSKMIPLTPENAKEAYPTISLGYASDKMEAKMSSYSLGVTSLRTAMEAVKLRG